MKHLKGLYSKVRLLTILAMTLAVLTYIASQKNSAQSPSCLTSQWAAEGNANDTTGINPATLMGGVTFAPGETGQAFSLDGSTGYVEVPINSPAMNSPVSFTWEAWVNPSSLNYPVIFQKGSAVVNRAGLQIFPDGSLCSFLNSTFCSAISAAGVIQTGQFTKVTMLYDGATQELHTYANNVQVSSAAVSSAYNNTEPFIIGFSATPVGYNAHFPGLIDEVSFSSCAIRPTPSPTLCGSSTTAGLVGYWPEDGNANDVGGGNNPSATNGITFVPGKVAQGVTFGTGGYIEVPDDANLDTPTITLTAWALPNGQATNNDVDGDILIAKDTSRLFTNLGGPQVSIGLFWRASDNRFVLAVGKALTVEPYIPSTNAFAPGQFYHVAGSYDGTTAKLYVNGQLEASQVIDGAIDYDHTVPWTIGSGWRGFRNAGYPRTWNGVIDDVRVYDRALTAQEIAGLYADCNATPSPTPSPSSTPTPTPCTPNTVLFSDNFDSENGGVPVLYYGGLANWDVSKGSIDLLGPSLLTGTGMYLDLDGTGGGSAGTLVSKRTFTLPPGSYQLQFDLAGNQRNNDADTVNVSLGDAYFESFTLNGTDPLRTITRTINVTAPTSGNLVFEQLGYDFVGLLLDNVKLQTLTCDSPSPTPTPTPTPSPTPAGSCSVTLTVPGSSNPWLAGMPNGTLASPWPDGSHVGSAPEQSPVLVTGIPVTGGVELTFSATGRVSFAGGPGVDPPDGHDLITSHAAGAEHGVSQITTPFDSLVGVFLDATQPDLSQAPVPIALDFSTAESRDYTTLSPALKQVFFIGDGRTSAGITQSVVAPAGATRLFLGTMDSYGWDDNTGSFTVTITGSCGATPMPTITGGLPPDSGILGPGTLGNPGHVSTTVAGTGNPGCTIQLTVTDPHETGGNNNRTLTTPVDSSGNWTIPLTLDDCDPIIDIVQICDGVSSNPVHRHILVDGTPPVFTGGGPGDGVTFITGGAGGGSANIILDGSASDPNTSHCVNCGGVSYQWNLIGGGAGGADLILGSGGANGTLLNGGSGLSIDLPPGDYDIEVIVTDAAGNQLIKHCHRHVRRPVTVTSGLLDDNGIYGPGDGVTVGKVTRTLGGTGNPGCSVRVTITDTHHPGLADNNTSYTAPVDSSGNWSLSLTLDDCDPVIDIVEICDGADSGHITRHVYVDGTPPHFTGGGPSDGLTYTSGGAGTGHIVLSGGASDDGTEVPNGGVTYGWILIGGGAGGTDLVLGGGGRAGVLTGGGSGLEIDLPPGDYDFAEQVCDTAGNCFTRHCRRRVCRRLTVTSGLPGDGGIYGPGDGVNFGHVSRVITGTGNPGCKVNLQVSDPTHPQSVANNQTYSTTVGNNGTWSLPLTLDDCDPVVTVTEVCDGISDSGDVIRQHIYVDGTPPTLGLADGMIYVGPGGAGGIVLDAGASDAGSEVPNNGLRYDWYLIGGGGGGTPILLCGGCPGNYTVNEPAGDYYFQVVVTDRAGNKTTKRCHRTVLKRPTAITYTGDVLVANGGIATLQGVLTDITPPIGPAPVPVVGRTVSLTLGNGPTAQSCTGITDSTGFVRCTVSPVNQPLGPSGMATDVFAGDDVYLPSNNGAHTLIFTFATATGNFVIGDVNAKAGNQVTFWGAQWARQNSLSGGSANNSFKGFENQSSTTPPACGGTWTTDPGNSSGPPASIPSYMGVIVSSSITKSGSNIAGNIPQIVIVKTDAGYASNPGHAGTGTVVAVFCK